MSRGVFHEWIGGRRYLVRVIEERRDVTRVRGVYQPQVTAWLPREPASEPEYVPLGVGLAALCAVVVALVAVTSVLWVACK